MNRKRLLITSTDLMMIQFLMPHVRHLSENGFAVELACSEVGGRLAEVREAAAGYAEAVHQVSLVRSPFSPGNIRGYVQLEKLLKERRYDIIWTNEPVMGVVTRLAARHLRSQGTKVVYMCHGFHFYKGASLANWLLFYPVERLMSRFCDVIVTMNEEDYRRAKVFSGTRVKKIPGVGVQAEKFYPEESWTVEAKQGKRKELKIPDDAFFLLSVGELTKRKNHQAVIRAMAGLSSNIHYAICGCGEKKDELVQLAAEHGLADRVHFLDYRRDVPEICRAANAFAFPSRQEGLPFALMEAMVAGLPIVCSDIRGNADLIDNGKGGYVCPVNDVAAYRHAIERLMAEDCSAMVVYNQEKVKPYCFGRVKQKLQTLLEEL